MGTRSLIGYRKAGQEKLIYVHWDGYPQGVGEAFYTVLRYLRQHREIYVEALVQEFRPGLSSYASVIDYGAKEAGFSLLTGELLEANKIVNLKPRHVFRHAIPSNMRTGGGTGMTYYPKDEDPGSWGTLAESHQYGAEYAYIYDVDTKLFEIYAGYNRLVCLGKVKFGREGKEWFSNYRLKHGA